MDQVCPRIEGHRLGMNDEYAPCYVFASSLPDISIVIDKSESDSSGIVETQYLSSEIQLL